MSKRKKEVSETRQVNFFDHILQNKDVSECITRTMGPFDKYILAGTCTNIRVILSDFFASWDMEIAKSIASHVDANHTTRSYHMEVFDENSDRSLLFSNSWPTSKMEEVPLMTFRRNEDAMSNAYELGSMENIKATYRLDPRLDKNIYGEKKVFYAHPVISSAEYGNLLTLKNVPVDTIEWEVHPPEMNRSGFFYGPPVWVYVDDAQAVYIGENNIVSADVSTVNPRIKFELMGVSIINRSNYNNGPVRVGSALINMLQLRLYIKKAVMSSEMMKRSQIADASNMECDLLQFREST